MKHKLFVVLALLVCATLVSAQEPIYDHFVFLPLVLNNSDIVSIPVCDCSYNRYNCGDFNSQVEAQACYEYCMADVGRDVHDLDRDGDRTACEEYYYGGTPTNTPTFTPTPTPIPTNTPTETLIPTETPTETPTPTEDTDLDTRLHRYACAHGDGDHHCDADTVTSL